jgi:hypothetical protein
MTAMGWAADRPYFSRGSAIIRGANAMRTKLALPNRWQECF